MANLLTGVTKVFSYNREYLRTNIVSSPITPTLGNTTIYVGSNDSAAKNGGKKFSDIESNTISYFFESYKQFKKYENTGLVTIINNVFRDYSRDLHNKDTKEVISIKSTEATQLNNELVSKINLKISELQLIPYLIDNIGNLIYYGSISIGVDGSSRLNLSHPNFVIEIREDNELVKYITISNNFKLKEVETDKIIRIGANNIELVNDSSNESLKEDGESVFKKYSIFSSRPLFYEVLNELKEYLVKEKIISILGIKELIQPLLVLAQIDRNSDPSQANELAIEIEQRINQYNDSSLFISSHFDIDELIESMVNNIRVLPDYQGSMGSLAPFELGRFMAQSEEIRNDQNQKKEELLNVTGIPLDLLTGRSSRWEALKTSERLNSRLNSLISSINMSLCRFASELYNKEISNNKSSTGVISSKESGENLTKPEDFVCNLFRTAEVDFGSKSESYEVLEQTIRKSKDIIDSIVESITENKILDIKEYCTKLKSMISSIDPNLSSVISDELINKLIEKSQSDEDSDY